MKTTLTLEHEVISQRAHQIWELAGKPEGRDTELWLQAENELRASASEAYDIAQEIESDRLRFNQHPAEKALHSTSYAPAGVTTDALHHVTRSSSH